METVCALFEFTICKIGKTWHVTCGFPLMKFATKREAVAWCKRARRAFLNAPMTTPDENDGVVTTPEYAAAYAIKKILMRVK